MLGAFVNAFRTPDLRKKLLFTLFIIAVFRLGSTVPAPGVNVAERPGLRQPGRGQQPVQPDQPVLAAERCCS